MAEVKHLDRKVTGPNGKEATSNGSATWKDGQGTFNGSKVGPKGRSSNNSGSFTYGDGSGTYNGTVTNGKGNSKDYSGSITTEKGNRTVTPSKSGKTYSGGTAARKASGRKH